MTKMGKASFWAILLQSWSPWFQARKINGQAIETFYVWYVTPWDLIGDKKTVQQSVSRQHNESKVNYAIDLCTEQTVSWIIQRPFFKQRVPELHIRNYKS
jgi:hypothetical protein